MERTVNFELSADEAKQIQAEMRAQIAGMQLINERIKKNQAETKRLRKKTQATLAELNKIISKKVF